jgi:hypothetical protein
MRFAHCVSRRLSLIQRVSQFAHQHQCRWRTAFVSEPFSLHSGELALTGHYTFASEAKYIQCSTSRAAVRTSPFCSSTSKRFPVLDFFEVFRRWVKDIQVLFPQGVLLRSDFKLISFKTRHLLSDRLAEPRSSGFSRPPLERALRLP